MSRSSISKVLVLVCLCFAVSKSYAWQSPGIYIYNWLKHRPLSCYHDWKEEIMADLISGGPIVTWDWDWPPQAYATEQGDWPDHSIAEGKFNATGRYYVYATGYDEYDQWDSDWALVYVFEMDLDISGVSDDDEEDPGGYVCLNDDDDNGNSTPDKDETGTVSGEDDLVAISLSYQPSSLQPGCIELEIPGSSSAIRVWSSSTKGTKVLPDGSNYYKRWPIGSQPSTLYVEGYSTGTAELWLLYTPDCQYPYYPGGEHNHDPVKFTVVRVKIIEPDENPVTDNNFAFNSASPGACTVTAEGTTGVSSLDDDLEWALTAISGSTQTSNPDPPKGPTIAFTYTTLPSSNSEFGEKTLTLTRPGLPILCNTDTQVVEIFFHRDAYNHTGAGSGTTRNWYYYWKEGSVVSDLSTFGYQDQGGWGAYYPATGQLYVRNAAPISDYQNKTFTNRYYQTHLTSGADGIADTTAIEDDIQVIPVGQGSPNETGITTGPNSVLDTSPSGDDTIVGTTITTGANGVCNTTASGDDIQVILVGQGKPDTIIVTAGADNFLHTTKSGDDELDLTNAQSEPYNIDVSGIDCCAVTCVHELKHKELCEMSGPDSDEDDIPDSYELSSSYHLDPDRPDTYNCAATIGYGDDNEFLARMAEKNPGSTSPSEDWSDTNGKQWGQ